MDSYGNLAPVPPRDIALSVETAPKVQPRQQLKKDKEFTKKRQTY